MNHTKNRTVIYARYSSDKQDEASIETQIDICTKFANDNEMEIVGVYFDEALSGDQEERPEFLRMISDSGKNLFDYLVVYDLKRFARDVDISVFYNIKLKRNGVKRLSATERFDNSPSGRFTERMLEGVAELQLNEIKTRTNDGIRNKFKNGFFSGGTTPYGYDVVDKRFVINEIEAANIKEIFKMYLSGKGATQIAGYFNNLGFRMKKDAKFTPSKILHILKNEKYIGILRRQSKSFDGTITEEIYDSVYPGIVSKKDFLQINKYEKRSAPKNKERYLLSGKLYCGVCERNMIGISGNSKGKIYYYYSCNDRKRAHKCSMAYIKKDQIENAVVDILLNEVLTNDKLEKMAEDATEQFNRTQREKGLLETLKKEKSKLDRELANLVKAVKSGVVSTTINSALLETESKVEAIKNQIVVEEAKIPNTLSKDAILFFFNKLKTLKKKDIYKEILIDTFVDRVVAYENFDIDIVTNLDKNNTYKISLKDIISSSEDIQGVPF